MLRVFKHQVNDAIFLYQNFGHLRDLFSKTLFCHVVEPATIEHFVGNGIIV